MSHQHKDIPNKINQDGMTNFEIIGHPITLEDVLEALPYGFLVAGDGSFMRFYDGESICQNELVKWKFGKPFSEQPEETKEFISQLLNS